MFHYDTSVTTEAVDRTESTEMGDYDLFMDRHGNLRVFLNNREVGLFNVVPKEVHPEGV